MKSDPTKPITRDFSDTNPSLPANIWSNVRSHLVGDTGEFITYYIPLQTIDERFDKLSKNRLKKVNGKLFTVKKDIAQDVIPNSDCLKMIDNVEQFFALAHSLTRLNWHQGPCVTSTRDQPLTAITKKEYYNHKIDVTEPHYDTIEFLPHYPPLKNSFYVPYELPPATGKVWDEFVAHLNPATEMDSILIQAATLTPGWGGPPGRRPGFIFSSDYGVESGKTVTAEMVAAGYGERFDMSEKDAWTKISSSLMSSKNAGRRVVLIDNVKSRIDNSGLESLITSKFLAGWKLYTGQVQMPNYLTVLITANAPELSRDLVSRCVMIKIGEPIKDSNHSEWQEDFFSPKKLPFFMADVMAKIAMQKSSLAHNRVTDRHGPWQTNILTSFENAEEIADYIHDIRPMFDMDLKKAINISKIIEEYIERYRHRKKEPADKTFRISLEDVKHILVAAGEFKESTTSAYIGKALASLRACDALQPFSPDPEDSRFWIWTPPQAEKESV